ncbi:olfactory receptor 6K3-like [Zalophus californianus]|uniref:Olfactory receptor 6K3-like n=1 Tax=Zalophus californianus TaxID=9704 RepID=A0A6J2EQB5_ZALCA|nr:olfactory receptor 6K3-like [Zalophus californianus]
MARISNYVFEATRLEEITQGKYPVEKSSQEGFRNRHNGPPDELKGLQPHKSGKGSPFISAGAKRSNSLYFIWGVSCVFLPITIKAIEIMFEDGSLLLFIPLFIIYTFIVVGNLTIFFAVRMDTHLHNPMYNFISIFSFLEIWYTTATIPKMLSNLISEKKTISITGCLLQMYFFHSLGNSEGILLTTMAIDRYVAICNPLRYPTIMTPQLCAQLSAGSCIFGFLVLLPEIAWISTLPFCGPNQIHQIFCDFEPVLHLACTDTSVILIEDVIHAVAIIFSVLIIALSYIRIITVILRIPSAEGRQKAFSTCASHLGVFLMFYGSVSLMYLRFAATFPPILDTVIALMFAVLAPLFNPIIYSLRNKDMKIAIKKLLWMESQKWRRKASGNSDEQCPVPEDSRVSISMGRQGFVKLGGKSVSAEVGE